MALWSIDPPQNHDIYTVVYLLRDALKSALNDAWFFERTSIPKVEVRGAGHAEIAARLGRFRDGCMSFKEREALMLAKILRARAWAGELRKLVPEVQADIDQFLEATEPCEEISASYVKDAQSMFHGGGSLIRFLAARKPHLDEPQGDDEPSAGSPYLVGGRKALYELRAPCEMFLGQIEDEFFAASNAPGGQVISQVLNLLPPPEEHTPSVDGALH
jgi:hypothetical protein